MPRRVVVGTTLTFPFSTAHLTPSVPVDACCGSGAAQPSFSIEVAPGTRGVQPSVVLRYSSSDGSPIAASSHSRSRYRSWLTFSEAVHVPAKPSASTRSAFAG